MSSRKNTKTKANSEVELAALVALAQTGDRGALEEVCRRVESEIRKAVSRVIQEPQLVDDLCQETYIRLLQGLASLREPVKIKFFVAKLAAFVLKDYFRKRHKWRDILIPVNSETAGRPTIETNDNGEGALTILEIQHIVKTLPDGLDRKLFQLKLQGMKYCEIAIELQITQGSAKMRYKRALEYLRIKLRDD